MRHGIVEIKCDKVFENYVVYTRNGKCGGKWKVPIYFSEDDEWQKKRFLIFRENGYVQFIAYSVLNNIYIFVTKQNLFLSRPREDTVGTREFHMKGCIHC